MVYFVFDVAFPTFFLLTCVRGKENRNPMNNSMWNFVSFSETAEFQLAETLLVILITSPHLARSADAKVPIPIDSSCNIDQGQHRSITSFLFFHLRRIQNSCTLHSPILSTSQQYYSHPKIPNSHTIASFHQSSAETTRMNNLEQTEEFALLQSLFVLLQLLEKRILLGLGLGPGGLLGLGGLGTALGLGGALLGILKNELDGRSGTQTNGRQDTAQPGPAAGPHLVAKGRGAHGNDVALLDLWCEEKEGENR